MASSRRRSVRAARTVVCGSPSSCVQRTRLCASAASTVQAPLARKRPDGKCASAWSLRSAMTCSTTAWSRCSASTTASSSVRLSQDREVAPVGPQLGLRTDQARAPDDQPPPAVDGFGDLRLALVGVVDAMPGVLVDLLDGGADGLGHAHGDRVLPAGLLQALEHPRVPESRVGPEQLGAGGAGPLDAGDQLVDEALDALLRVGRPLPEADVQHLARV